MLNKKKVELMSKVALYEHGEGKTTLRLNKYYKTDYSSANFLASLPLGILTGILILVLIFVADTGWLGKLYDKIGGTWAVILLIAAFVLFVVGYSFFSLYMFNHKYDKYRGNLMAYGLNLRRLNKIYEEEKQMQEVRRTGTDDS
ncbi:MAG: hypothetical protein IKF90_20270 [Parasporobacterium sp.]|nr:hypothetical protein [Parasporobacterium sp.]